jgi:hypothetical protein
MEAIEMFHPDTQFLIDRWSELARESGVRGGIPARARLRPEILGARLCRTFIIEGTGPSARFRLAGSWLEAFRDRPMAGRPFLDLWCETSTDLVVPALTQAIREARPVVIVSQSDPEGRHSEVALAPLSGSGPQPDLFIGLVSVTGAELSTRGPHRLSARLTIGAGEPGRPDLRLIASGGASIAASGR